MRWLTTTVALLVTYAAHPCLADEIKIVAWNVESGGNVASVIASELEEDFEGVDIWGLSEVRASNAHLYVSRAGEGESADYRGVLGTTGGDDRLLAIYDASQFALVQDIEIEDLAFGGGRAPLALRLVQLATGHEFFFIVNHFHRTSAEKRLKQAVGLREWALDQGLPVITVGDFNFDFDVPDGPGNPAFAALVIDNTFKWIKPESLVTTNWSDRDNDGVNDFNSVLDFAFVSGLAQLWEAQSHVLVRDGDFPDTTSTSDHRPVVLVIDPSSLTPAPGPELRLAGSFEPFPRDDHFGLAAMQPSEPGQGDASPMHSHVGACIQAFPEFLEAQLEARDKALESLRDADGPVYEYVISKGKRWLPGTRITVAFQGGSYLLQKQIADTASAWEAHGNFKFDFGHDTVNRTFRQWSSSDIDYTADIRVSFNYRGYWSLVGTDSNNPAVVQPNQPSLNLGGFHLFPPADWRATALHEFGHALGFQHEHQSPVMPCDFRYSDDPGYVPTTDTIGQYINDSSGRRPGLYTLLGGPPNNWDRAKIDHNLNRLTSSSSAYLIGSSFDSRSIMKYFFEENMFISGRNSPCFTHDRNLVLSMGDIQGVSIAYPDSEPLERVEERMSIAASLTAAQDSVNDFYKWQAYRHAFDSLAKSPFDKVSVVEETHLIPSGNLDSSTDGILFGSNGADRTQPAQVGVAVNLPVAKSQPVDLQALFSKASELMPGARKEALIDYVKQSLGIATLSEAQAERLDQEMQWLLSSPDKLALKSWVRVDAALAAPREFGHFEGQVETVWLDERNMKLSREFVYIDQSGKRWLAPAGSVVNGASIPRAFWTLIGAPFSGEYRSASVVHDVYCENKSERWRDVHRMFYHACRAGGVSKTKAKIMYYAVYHFGPRWNEPDAAAAFSLPAAMVPEDVIPMVSDFIELNDPSLEQIEAISIDRLPRS